MEYILQDDIHCLWSLLRRLSIADGMPCATLDAKGRTILKLLDHTIITRSMVNDV